MRLPEGRIVHRSPGRLRIRVAEQVQQSDYFHHVHQRLLEHPQIREVEVRAQTGSILITGRIPEIDALSDFVENNALFRLDPESTVRHQIYHTFAHSNEKIISSSQGQIDLPILIFLLLILSGILQIIRSGFQLPPWHTAFWYALGVFTLPKIDFEAGEENRAGINPGPGDS